MPRFRDYSQTTFLDPTDAFLLDRVGTGTLYIEAQDLQSGAPYEASFEFLGLPPNASEFMGAHFFPVGVSFEANMASSVGESGGGCGVAPGAAFAATVYHKVGASSTSIGTMNIDTSGVLTFSTTATTFAAGDSITFAGPVSPDGAIENIWWTIFGAQT